jgi:hypothetical protein
MRGKGITYDTGFISGGASTHEPFDPEIVKHEMRIIRDDLHCNAVRMTGGHPDRLEIAACFAAGLGLEVWFSPFWREDQLRLDPVRGRRLDTLRLRLMLDGDYSRDENEQATYLRELLDIFNAEGVDTAFVCTFASYNLPHRSNPREDFDNAVPRSALPFCRHVIPS